MWTNKVHSAQIWFLTIKVMLEGEWGGCALLQTNVGMAGDNMKKHCGLCCAVDGFAYNNDINN